MNAPQVSLKVIWGAHFILTVCASMSSLYLPPAYIYMNTFILVLGIWALIQNESPDAVFMFMLMLLASIMLDIIFIAVHQPRAFRQIEILSGSQDLKNEYRFSLGMSIVNLIIKPITSFILYRIYQDRGGSYANFNIPGMPTFTGSPQHHGGYDNIDQAQPVPSNNVETAEPHQTFEKPPIP
ncbi:unnamed protein product [Owenia fusiformis]|uniref:Uncharacterized protein n=1 Tax=Owenia fusiformis TaxID=6347 RepID=A0A8J1UBL3_OWEFU|nr:unnamed protein product [Owenia fusiformis]